MLVVVIIGVQVVDTQAQIHIFEMAKKDQKCRCRLKTVAFKIIAIAIAIFCQSGLANIEDGVIYVLLWTSIHDTPFIYLDTGRQAFVKRNCTFQNCYITNKVSYFHDILEFDVIIFNRLGMYRHMQIPDKRSENQNYIYASIEPAGMHKIPTKYNKWFNLTWTYKLDSDAVFPYIVIKNDRDEIIGPKLDMHWIDIKDMNETNEYVINKLRKKRFAAAWFVSNCEANERLEFGRELQKELAKHGHRLDIYGNCGDKLCPTYSNEDMDECYALVESFYYFYLAFENSFCEDYVTEKILTGLEHFSVLVVFGGANYTRFMPEGTFIRAHTLGPAKLAKEMVDIIHDKKRYYDFFKWHGYYSFHHTAENKYLHQICGLCEMLNNKTHMRKKKVYNTNLWWNERYKGPPPDDSQMYLIIVEEKSKSGVVDLVSNIYNYLFES